MIVENSYEWKTDQKLPGSKLRGFREIEEVPLISLMKMTSVIRNTHLTILEMKRLRRWVPPTQFKKLSKNFKIEFPGNSTKILISRGSTWFTESVLILLKWKLSHRKKNMAIPNPGIQPRYISWSNYGIYIGYGLILQSSQKSDL